MFTDSPIPDELHLIARRQAVQRAPHFIEFSSALPSVRTTGKWRERGGWSGGRSFSYSAPQPTEWFRHVEGGPGPSQRRNVGPWHRAQEGALGARPAGFAVGRRAWAQNPQTRSSHG